MEEIQNELNDIKRMLRDVSYQMQELRESIRRTSFPAPMLPVPQPYVHPWWQYQWPGSQPYRNYQWGTVTASGSSPVETGSTVSGAAKAA
jgi:hypothetical protein